MIQNIKVEVNDPYPKYSEIYIHELDKYTLNIYFTKNSEAWDVDISENGSYNVEYNVTLNNNIIVTGAVARDIPGHNGVAIKLADLNINTSGILKIEFVIETREVPTPATVISPVSPLVINVKPSIIDEATVTPESEGTIAELLRLYPDLVAILADPTDYIPNGSITSAMIGDGEIRQADLHDSSVTGAKINNGAVTTDKIAEQAITTAKIAENAVTTGELANNAVYPGAIQNNAVTTAKLANRAITSEKIGNGEIKQANLAASSVTGDKINDSAVTTEKLASSAVTNVKIADGAVSNSKLDSSLQAIIGRVPTTPMSYSSLGIQNASDYFDKSYLCKPEAEYHIQVDGPLAISIGVPVQTLCILKYIESYDNDPKGYQLLEIPLTNQIFYRAINVVTPFVAGNWIEAVSPSITALTSRVADLEAANTILENAINGVT